MIIITTGSSYNIQLLVAALAVLTPPVTPVCLLLPRITRHVWPPGVSMQRQRTVYRLTLVKAWNVEEMQAYSELVALGQPDFIEVKVGLGVTVSSGVGSFVELRCEFLCSVGAPVC